MYLLRVLQPEMGTPSRRKRQAKGKEKESDKPGESDDGHANNETEEEDPAQVLETRQKRKRLPASQFHASTYDSGKDQSTNQAKTAVTASAEFKPPSRSGAQSSGATVASPSGTSTVARSLGCTLAEVAGRKKK